VAAATAAAMSVTAADVAGGGGSGAARDRVPWEIQVAPTGEEKEARSCQNDFQRPLSRYREHSYDCVKGD